MPKIADIQETPNPNAVKFILKEPVSHGTSHSFQTAVAAEGDKLAAAIFDVGDVECVTLEQEHPADILQVLRPRPAQFLDDQTIVLFEFVLSDEGLKIFSEKHYLLVRPEDLSAEEVTEYQKRMLQ